MDMQADLERAFIFESARQAAESAYAENPLDAENLTKWAGSLLELSQYQPVVECKKMVSDAVSKLEEALEINPKKHDAMWSLGNALTNQAFLLQDMDEAAALFKKASEYYQKACDEDPTNEMYRKSCEVIAKAPEMYAQFHKEGIVQQAMAAGQPGPSNSSSKTSTKTKKSNDLWYDIMGWGLLAVGIVAWVGFAKNSMPAPQSAPR